MARTKNYDAHITNLQAEITATESKLLSLRAQLETLQKEKEEYDVNALYKYIRANNISIHDIAKTLESDKDVDVVINNNEPLDEVKKTVEHKKRGRKPSATTTVTSNSKSSKSKNNK